MAGRRLFHITSAQDWRDAERRGAYTADSLRSEGFIHCSEAHQVVQVANQRFHGRSDLVLLHIDEAALEGPVRNENLEGGEELFPHVYGALNLDAIVGVSPFAPDGAGRFDHHRDEIGGAPAT